MSSRPPPSRMTSVSSRSVPSVREAHRAPTNLPVPLTSFVGREQEIATVTEFLREREVRLLTISGTGGVGKTRLALRVLENVHGDFADGVAFVPLASIRDPELVLPTLAHLLMVPDAPGQPVIARLRAFLADRNMLLVLDNFEHLLVAAPLVATLLVASPRLKILSTSRTPLSVSGEHVIAVHPLIIDAARQLFEERARAVVSSFTVTTDTAPILDTICARLDRLPLAIELAAVRVSVMHPRALLERLGQRLPLLKDGPQDVPLRLQSMRDAIDWSYDLLEANDRRLLHRLAVFVGGFSLDAADAVAGDGPDVLDGVTRLVSSNLVDVTVGLADEPRFTMLETIREYALEQLALSGEEASARQSHASYFRGLSEAMLPLYDGPELRTAIDRIELELGNCRAALAWSLESDEAETGVRLAGALWQVWWYGHAAGTRPWTERVREGREWLSRVLVRSEGLPVEVLVEALTGAGMLARLQWDLDQAEAYGEELLTRSRAEGFPRGIFWALHMLGCVAEARKHDDARQWYAQALAVTPSLEDGGTPVGNVLSHLGRMALRAGDLSEAATHLEDALTHYRSSGNLAGTATAALYLGAVVRQRGERGPAAQLVRESLVLFMDQRDLGAVHAALTELGRVALDARQPVPAARLLATAASFPGHPDDAPEYERAVGDARSLLSAPAFASAWETGSRLSWDETLAEVDRITAITLGTAAPHPEHRPDGLTRREVEVLRLLADGHPNREIADALSLSQRTVENHVQHILNKLGCESRTAAAIHAVRLGLI